MNAVRMSSLTAALIISLAGVGGCLEPHRNDKAVFLDAGPGQKPFDVTRHSVPIDEIIGGGPPKDGIPAIDNPKFVAAELAEAFLKPEDRVLGVYLNEVAKAYPINILNWHEIVNDDYSGRPATVTW